MFTNTYGNFAQAKDEIKQAVYVAISFLTNFVLNNANDGDTEKEEYIYKFNDKDVVLIPIYNGIIGEIENLRIIGLMVDDIHDLWVLTKEEKYSLTDYCTDINVVGAVWNITDVLYKYFD